MALFASLVSFLLPFETLCVLWKWNRKKIIFLVLDDFHLFGSFSRKSNCRKWNFELCVYEISLSTSSYFYFFLFLSDLFLPHKNQRFSGDFWQNSITIRVVSMLIRFLFCNKTMSSVWLCSGDKHLNWVAILFKFIHEPNPRGYKNLSTLRLSGIAKSFLSLLGKSPLELHKSLGINKILLEWLWGQATRELHIETAFWLNFYPTK